MKLTIEGKPDEIKSMFGDSVLNKTVNPEKPDKIVEALKKAIDEAIDETTNSIQREWENM